MIQRSPLISACSHGFPGGARASRCESVARITYSRFIFDRAPFDAARKMEGSNPTRSSGFKARYASS